MHLLLVTIDSLRGDHLGCYGAQDIRTPHLDTFAGSGVRFHQNLSSLVTTLPSHTSLMTGCVPSVHGVNWNGVVTPRRRRTLAEIAAAAGVGMVVLHHQLHLAGDTPEEMVEQVRLNFDGEVAYGRDLEVY